MPVQVVEFREPGLFAPRDSGGAAASAAAASRKRARPGDAAQAGKVVARAQSESKRAIWASVAELGVSGFKDAQRKAYDSSRLAAAGGVVRAPQRMPFKMFLGVSKARRERTAKEDERTRVSGVVKPGGKKKKERKQRERAALDEPIPRNIVGSVMHARDR